MSRTPCIVITRDRVSFTRLCVASLERFSSQLEIIIVDHGSTWPSMLEYLDESPHPSWRLGDRSPRSLWEWEKLQDIVGNDPYLVTDPDLILDEQCPDDWLQKLELELRITNDAVKIGLGLRIDDLPDSPASEQVRDWESQFWGRRTWTGRAWAAPVDTTLALYRTLGFARNFALGPAARLDTPYLLRHLPWYGELDDDEAKHYRTHIVPGSSFWVNEGR